MEGTDPRDSNKCLGHFARSTSHRLCHPDLPLARFLQVPHHVTRPNPCRVLELAPWPPHSLLYCPCKQPWPTCWKLERRGDSPARSPLPHWAKPGDHSCSSPSRAACVASFRLLRGGLWGATCATVIQALLIIAAPRCLQNRLAPCHLEQQRRKGRLSTATGLVC